MSLKERLKLGVPKRTLLFLAALIWGFAGQKVFLIGIRTVLDNSNTLWIYLMLAFLGTYFFFKFILLPVFFKYITRIYQLEIEKPCIFSFFSWRGYGFMVLMIMIGILFKQIKFLPINFIGALYMTIGSSLVLACLSFLYAGLRYDYFYKKFIQEQQPPGKTKGIPA